MKIKTIIAFAAVAALIIGCKAPEAVTGGDDSGVPATATDTWLVNSLADIETYASAEPSNRASYTLVKNETEHVQLVISTASNETLTIERSGAPEAIGFECRQLRTFEGMQDVLVPCDGTVKPANKLVKVWLSFSTTAESVPGNYREVITFRNANSGAEYAVALSITIVDAAIPETPSIPCVFGINPDNFILTGLDEEQKAAKRKEVADLLLDYRISPYFSSWLSGTMKTECFSSPYGWDDDRTWEYLKDPRFTRVALPFHGLDDSELEQMLARAQQEGILDKAYFYVWDEPTKVSEYEQIHDMADRLHRYASEADVLTSFYCGPVDGDRAGDLFATFDLLSGATSIFCTSTWALEDNETRAEMCRQKLHDGQEWWSYVCMSLTPGLAQNSSGIPNRACMWRFWKEQNTGFLYWVVNGFSSMSPLKSRSDLPEGDGILVYPGEPFDSDRPCVSIRLERWRDGAEDYELLKMYEAKSGRAAAEELLYNVYKGPANYTDNVKYADALKKNLVEAVAE